MLFTCLPEGAQIPGRFPGPMHARGKWFTIDIHCHVLTPQAEEMVRAPGSKNWQPRHQFANEHTRQINREQAERNRIQFSSVEKRLADMDRMGIDIQAITPSPAQTYYSAEPDLGHRHRANHQRQPRGDLRETPRALRWARHGAVPGPRAGRRRAR